MKILNKTLKALLAISLAFGVSAAEEIKASSTDCEAKVDSGKRSANPKVRSGSDEETVIKTDKETKGLGN